MTSRRFKRRYRRSLKRRGFLSSGRSSKRARTTRFRNVVPMGRGFPKKTIMTHRYVETINVNSGAAGAIANYFFSANGMFDPNQTGSGHQPMYFDQMGALYDHYHVIGSKITVEATTQNNTFAAGTFGVFLNDDTTNTPATVTGACEQGSARYKHFPANSNNNQKVKKKWSAKKTFGGTVLSNTSLQGTTSANPTEQTFYNVFWGADDLTSNFQLTFIVTIEYIAVWDEVKDIAQS